jgi:redox-sensitive bicupin YhaK (pirin superfamily)
LSLPSAFNTAIVVLQGRLSVNRSEKAGEADLILFETKGQEITLEAEENATLLVLSGQPIEEPIASYGPFVMNTQEEIRQAMDDYRSGRMGTLDIPIKRAGTS